MTIKDFKCLGIITGRKLVMVIAIFEMIISCMGMFYFYFTGIKYPEMNSWIPLPEEMLNYPILAKGIWNSLGILSALEFLLSITLFEGARLRKIERVRFWLISMLTFVILVSIIIIGFEMAGSQDTRLNAIAFLNIFIHFAQFSIVYVYIEESKKPNRKFTVDQLNLNAFSRVPPKKFNEDGSYNNSNSESTKIFINNNNNGSHTQ